MTGSGLGASGGRLVSAGSADQLTLEIGDDGAGTPRPAEATLAAPAGRPSPTQLKVLPGTSWADIFEDAA